MKKKYSFLLIFIALAASLYSGCTNSPTSASNKSQEFEFSWLFLDVFFIYRDKLPANPYVYTTPAQLYQSVGEPYTKYFGKTEAKTFLDMLTTRDGGIGIMLDSVATGYVITRVIKNSPAEKAGLAINDTITAVNGTSLTRAVSSHLSTYLGGPAGETKRLTIRRTTQELIISVTLDIFLWPSVFTDSLDSAVAYIALTAFLDSTGVSGGSAQEMSDALAATRRASCTIMDLRGNGGGELNQCVNIISNFVPRNTRIIRSRQREYDPGSGSGLTVDSVWTTSTQGAELHRAMYILVDSNTASASEILVSCLKENRSDIKIFGTRTYGKARGQRIASTPDSGLVKATFSTLTPLSGPDYDLVGIAPTVALAGSQDALKAALNDISGKTTSSATKKRLDARCAKVTQRRMQFPVRSRIPLCILKR